MRFYSYFFLFIGVLLAFFVHLSVGEYYFSLGDIFVLLFSAETHPKAFIFWEIRLPRTLTALCVGGSVGVSGLLSQTFFRNALAEPNLLGITSGASLGVAFLTFGIGGGFTQILLWQGNSVWLVFFMSALGAFLVMLLMLGIAWRVQEPTVLLVCGLMVGSFVSALVGLWQYFSHPEQLQMFIRWGMGSLGGLAYSQLKILFLINFITILCSFLLIKWLNIWLMGDMYAQSLGVSLWKMRVFCILLISILAGSVTAFCGLIGFLGVIIPHLSRWYARSNHHQILVPLCVIFGCILMLFCDMITKISVFGGVLPLNTITALVGVPVILGVVMGYKNT